MTRVSRVRWLRPPPSRRRGCRPRSDCCSARPPKLVRLQAKAQSVTSALDALERLPSMPIVINTRLIKLKDIDGHEERAWRELADRALEPNPYFEPDYLALSAKHFESYAETTLVVAHEGDTFRGLLPIVKFETSRVPPRAIARIGTFLGGFRALGTPLVDAACPDLAAAALLDALQGAARERGWPGILFMDFVGSDGRVAESLLRVCDARGTPVFTK